MFVNEVNDVKIYNLSAGKSVPEWLTDRRKRSQLLKKVDSRRQIELIQDFDMPGVCTSIRMSPDHQYILATGTYKPRVKCFEVCNLSIKFERCFDSEVTSFEIISDDYSKLVFLQCDRYIEIHAAHGRHYRLRIPRFGRDIKYHKPSCDLFVVGTSKDIYRLNLERGQFLQPFESKSTCLNVCDVNPEHHLLMVGSKDGTVEAWDPRTKQQCASLDVAMKLLESKEFPAITALSFKNGLQMAVGTASGHVLLYDIRSKDPLLIKDHLNKVPIKRISFNASQQTVYSLDEAMLKLWEENTGRQIAYIESITSFNDFCTIPDTGMFFLAQEDVKMLTYYVPSMGPAPRWCSFLDTFAEQIESEVVENMYDDYQFVTHKELEELGMDHLIGSNLLKAYMHGYFMDVRLYNKAKAAADPFAFERFRMAKISQEIENERQPRLQLSKKLPKVNQELALKILHEEMQVKPKANNKLDNNVISLLNDTRFKAMFENTDFEINKNAEEYKLLAPVLKRLDNSKLKELKKCVEVAHVNELHADEANPHEESDNDEDLFGFEIGDEEDATSNKDDDSSAEASTDEEDRREFAKDMKRAYKDIKRQKIHDELKNNNETAMDVEIIQTPLTNSKAKIGIDSKKIGNGNFKLLTLDGPDEQIGISNRVKKISLQQRVRAIESINSKVSTVGQSLGNRQMTFDLKKTSREAKKREIAIKKHREERKQVIRPIYTLKLKKVNFK